MMMLSAHTSRVTGLGAARARCTLTRLCSSTPRAAATAASRGTPPHSDPHQQLVELCAAYGVRLAPELQLRQQAQWGLGLWLAPAGGGADQQQQQQKQQQQQQAGDVRHSSNSKQQQQQQLVVSVPLDLVLSCGIAGGSPPPHATPPQLQRLLHDSVCARAWELQVAALLLWALRQPRTSRIGGFWRQYAARLLPRTTSDCSSLLVWGEHELAQLQDSELQATAQAWQRLVQEAYESAVRPCFGSAPDAAAACSLEEWRWAVAVVESRAFGVPAATHGADTGAGDASSAAGSAARSRGAAAAAGSPVGLVPVLDLANHSPRSACRHGINSSSGTFDLHLHAQQHHALHRHGQQQERAHQVLITYGSKDNRSLIEQYGFSVPGNPHDRLPFPPAADLLPHGGQQRWMSHAAVKSAAAAVLAQLQEQHVADREAYETMVATAVTSIVQAAGWRNLQQYRQVSPHSTRACAAALLAWARRQQEAASTISEWHGPGDSACSSAHAPPGRRALAATSLAHDAALLRQPATAEQPRLMAALQYRMVRKQLLDAATAILERVLAVL